MTPVDTRGCTRIQVVDAHQVEALTRSGWILLGTTEDTRSEFLRKEIPPRQDPNQPYTTFPTVSVTDQALKTVTVYVLGLDEKSALTEATTKLTELEAKVREAEEKLRAEKMAVGVAEKKLTEAESRVDAAKAQAGTLQTQVEGYRTREGTHLTEIQTLKAQVANLTQAFGQIKVNTATAKPEGDPNIAIQSDVENPGVTRFERVRSDT